MTPISVRTVWPAWRVPARVAVLGSVFLQILACAWGPTPDPATLPALALEDRVESFHGSPLTEGAVATRSLLISAGEESPLLASSMLLGGARVGRTDDALHFREALVQRRWGPSVETAALTGRLENGKTASFRFEQPSAQESGAKRAFQVDVHRDANGSIVVAIHVS